MELKPIPFSSGFFASRDGRIFDKDLKERIQYENGDGYKTASILVDKNWRTFTVQRLAASAFKPIDNMDDFIVNHRDLDKHNNNIENLEWVTVEENNLHAALFRENPLKPIAFIEKNGEYSIFTTLCILEAFLKVSGLDIWDAVRTGNRINGYKVKVITNKTVLPKALRKSLVGIKPIQTPIKAYNINTEEILHFPSVNEAARYFNVDAGHISSSLTRVGKLSLFKEKFILLKEDEEIPVFDKEKLLEGLGSLGFDVITFDIEHQRYEIYPSASRFIKEKNLSKKAVTTRLKQGKIGPVDGYYFSYYKTPNKQHLFEVVGRPGP